MDALASTDGASSSVLSTPESSSVAIVLVDASGSTVLDRFPDGEYVWDRMRRIVLDLDHSLFRLVFWNGGNPQIPYFNGNGQVPGTYRLIAACRKPDIDLVFAQVKPHINRNCLTYPHLGFNAILQEWWDQSAGGPKPSVYLVTDGQMGYGNISTQELYKCYRDLHQAIQALPPSTDLRILSVETKARDYNDVNEVEDTPGVDVLKAIAGCRNSVNEFISYSPNTTPFHHIERARHNPGFIPYGGQQFLESQTRLFVQEMKRKFQGFEGLGEQERYNAEVLELQKLSNTLDVLTKNKPKPVADPIINQFVDMFHIGRGIVSQLLKYNIDAAQQGRTQIISSIRAQLRNLYQKAAEQLKAQAFVSAGGRDEYITWPAHAHAAVLIGSGLQVQANVFLPSQPRKVYRQGAVGSIKRPVLPLIDPNVRTLDPFEEQCLRQWIRLVVAHKYQNMSSCSLPWLSEAINVRSDLMVYLVMAQNWRVQQTPSASDRVKRAFRYMARVMLRKRRTQNAEARTDWDVLMNRQAPYPNSGQLDHFLAHMRAVACVMAVEPGEGFRSDTDRLFNIWYHLCFAVAPELAQAQALHCPKTHAELKTRAPELVFYHAPPSHGFDFTCLVTLEDTSSEGGYVLEPHQTGTGSICGIRTVFSSTGCVEMKLANQGCPVCFLQDVKFVAMKPKETWNMPTEFSEPLLARPLPPFPLNTPGISQNTLIDESRSSPGVCRDVVVLKGVVGAGKSTAADWIRDHCQEHKVKIIILSTDRLILSDPHPRMGRVIHRVKRSLDRFLGDLKQNEPAVIVVDTCGDRSSRFVFGHLLEGWTRREVWPNYNPDFHHGYLAWSLWNVLNRQRPPTRSDTYALYPKKATTPVCRTVHRTKHKNLFPNREWNFENATHESLEPQAKAYKETLSPFSMDFSFSS